MLTVNSALYKDVNHQDFNHYFANTAMAWKLSKSKRRLFLVSGLQGGEISGTYLTRDSEFKEKMLPFKEWWDSLDVIAIQPLMFNVPGGCGTWCHKFNKNLRKSFPWSTNNVLFFGDVEAKHKALQFISRVGFQELYGVTPVLPRLVDVLLNGLTTTVTREKFLVDAKHLHLYYKTRKFGSIVTGKITIPANKTGILPLLHSIGVPRQNIEVVAVEPPPKLTYEIVPMKHNHNYVEGSHKDAYEVGYIVVLAQPPGAVPIIRTYGGVFPGGHLILPGWQVYDYWGIVKP